MDRYPKKRCKFCGDPKPNHFPYTCPQNPKVIARRTAPAKPRQAIARSTKPLKRTRINRIGKVTQKWIDTRKEWLALNPPPVEGRFYICYLQISPGCPKYLDATAPAFLDDDGTPNPVAVTVDHVVARTRDPSKRFDLDNLKPACWYCNDLKGSKSVDQARADMLR